MSSGRSDPPVVQKRVSQSAPRRELAGIDLGGIGDRTGIMVRADVIPRPVPQFQAAVEAIQKPPYERKRNAWRDEIAK
jgi:hypothetical protein